MLKIYTMYVILRGTKKPTLNYVNIWNYEIYTHLQFYNYLYNSLIIIKLWVIS